MKNQPQKKAAPVKKKKWQRPDARRIVTSVLVLVMVLALVLPLVATVLPAHAASTSELRSKITELKKNASSYKQEQSALADKLNGIKNDQAQAQQQKAIIDQQMAAIQSQIDSTQKQIVQYDALIEQTNVELADAQAKEQEAYEKFCTMARTTEEMGSVSYLSVLFQAKSFSDLLDSLAMVDEILSYSDSVVEDLAAAKEAVQTKLDELNATKAELDAVEADLQTQEANQAQKMAEANALLKELAQQVDETNQEIAASKEEEEANEKAVKEAQAEIDRLQAEAQRKIDSGAIQINPGTGWAWPLPGNTRITSPFGNRQCPYHGYELHRGADISAAEGTAIHAARGGVVTVSGRHSSYGEYVVISHGNGVSTLYAHMSSRAVSAQQTVEQNQVIGYVGHTGSSQGRHLHFEVRINGSYVNPLNYY